MIIYTTGDATKPNSDTELTVIAHVCNNVGKYGAGFSGALEKTFPGVEKTYRDEERYRLGQTILHYIDDEERWHRNNWLQLHRMRVVAHMIAQTDPHPRDGSCKLDYDALAECLSDLRKVIQVDISLKQVTASLHMPRIGAGLAGGDWRRIERIIQDQTSGIPVLIYDLPPDWR